MSGENALQEWQKLANFWAIDGSMKLGVSKDTAGEDVVERVAQAIWEDKTSRGPTDFDSKSEAKAALAALEPEFERREHQAAERMRERIAAYVEDADWPSDFAVRQGLGYAIRALELEE